MFIIASETALMMIAAADGDIRSLNQLTHFTIKDLKERRMSNKELFIEICKKNIKRAGIDDLLKWLESSDFFEAPASTRYHGSYAGGLCEHSINVYKALVRLANHYPEFDFDPESLAIVALFHDLCKVNFYATEKRNRKNSETGQWESYDAYSIKEKFCFGGHGSKSVYLVQTFMKLSPEEAASINCHMGAFSDSNVGSSFEQFPLAWFLHIADGMATYVIENSKG